MAATRSAALKIDWTNLGTKLGLKGSTAQALANFKKRNDDARRRVQILSEQAQTVDFAYYRSTLKNTAIVDDIEKQFKGFAVKKYDVSRQIKAIEAFEAQAVKSAEETKGKVDAELKDLEKTLKNIETARPFEDLTVDEVVAARPEIDERVSQLISKGRWGVPGYKEKFGDMSFALVDLRIFALYDIVLSIVSLDKTECNAVLWLDRHIPDVLVTTTSHSAKAWSLRVYCGERI
nr:atp synthase subunit d, mitochondrial [Quercus suber]